MGTEINRAKKRRERERIRRKKLFILCTSIIVVSIGVTFAVASKFGDKKDKLTVNAGTNDIKENQFEEKKEPEKPKIDNSGYLSLEEDPNAEDATLVSENTNGLLTGTKKYPVRTDGKKVVYLTFDDGPSTTNTPEVLKILDKYNVKGTFFVMGTSIDKNDEAKKILKDIAKNGHAIANHTYGHDYNYLYPNRVINTENFMSDIEKNNKSMKNVLGKDFSTRVIRFPGGYWSWNGRTAMKEKMVASGYLNIDWDALNRDAEGPHKNADQLLQETKKTVEALGPNADNIVLLMHDTYGKEETVKALPQIIEYFQGKGFEFKTIK
ncbi:polysaccharide deacetylase family protein [Clostridium paraputrificum]|uniref:polysaccharide deacetylase family protein n=1 Tax=Clostridium TaxID=1485 RepID=UPI003D32EA8B